MPEDYVLGIVPASDTGAIEMAMWSMLGERGVDVLCWESFGSGWSGDCKSQLKLKDLRVLKADYGRIPDLSQVDWTRDVIFTWNGTTSGVRVPDANWIAADRQGLSLCDATSAVFAMNIDWEKLDVVTWSWQKVLGGEAAHGMLALSPHAVKRLESFTPDRPLPKIFQMSKGGKLIGGIFEGETINTPSMLCVEDALDGLKWAKSIGGLSSLVARSQANLKTIEDWVSKSNWAGLLAEDQAIRSSTSICLKITDPAYLALSADDQAKHAKDGGVDAGQGRCGVRHRIVSGCAGRDARMGWRDRGDFRHRTAAALAGLGVRRGASVVHAITQRVMKTLVG